MITFSEPQADEFPLIFDSWANSFRKSPWAGCVPNHLWDQVSRADIAGIIDRGARVVVALAPQVPGIFEGRRVMGYSVSEPGVLHWLYVKKDYRGQGVAKALLAETTRDWPARRPWLYTHRTRASAGFLGADFRHDDIPARVRSYSH